MAVTQAMNLRPMMQHKHSIFIYLQALACNRLTKKGLLTTIKDLVIQAMRKTDRNTHCFEIE
jgi:hypothetical protein